MANLVAKRLFLGCAAAWLLVAMTLVDEASATCYEDWSRCTPSTSWLTGILWKSCTNRCKELGHRRGDCRDSPSKCWKNNKQCYCF
uniref:Neuromacin propeptide n=1 Tax=Eisenia fetida TaxID=6396 RepID=A0A0M3WPR3_EISFE|nr:neuromacin propeptide [Eisenia fetida]